MLKIQIRPNGYAGHAHGDLIFGPAPRECVVDPAAEKVIDEKGKPLVLTATVYAQLQKKNGGPIAIEPLPGDEDGEVALLRAKIADLEAQLVEARKPAKK